jgi:hypothetical protein
MLTYKVSFHKTNCSFRRRMSFCFILCCAGGFRYGYDLSRMVCTFITTFIRIFSSFSFLFFFIFEGCILLRLLLQSLGEPSITTVFFSNVFLLLLLHTHYM